MSGFWEVVDPVSPQWVTASASWPLDTEPAAAGSDDGSESDAMIRVLLEKATAELPGEANDTAPAVTVSIHCPPLNLALPN